MDKHIGMKKNKVGKLFLLGCIWGSLLFLLIYRGNVLGFTSYEWAMRYNDITQHYVGWVAYRNSPWTFPLGLMNNLTAPFSVSVIYTDSIPLFAVFFKLLSPILPETFQYLGIFGLLCFALMGGFASILLRYFLQNNLFCILLSTFFVVSPYMLQRMFAHTALSAQWVIIAAICLWIYKPYVGDMGWPNISGEGEDSAKRMGKRVCLVLKNILLWSVLMVVTAGIHMYLVPMVFAFLFANVLENVILICRRKAGRASDDAPASVNVVRLAVELVTMLVPVIAAVIWVWILGGFYGGVSANSENGLGAFSANLNTFINSATMGIFMADLPQGEYQWDGYGYLGGGILLLLAVFIYRLCTGKLKELKTNKLRAILMAAVCCVLFVFAVSPVVTLGEIISPEPLMHTFEIKLPAFITNVWSIFRSTGRFIWPVCYCIFLAAIIFTMDREKKIKPGMWVFAVLMIGIQLTDLGQMIGSVRASDLYKADYHYKSKITAEAWDGLLDEHPHIFYMRSDLGRGDLRTYELALKAIEHGGDVNTFYLARNMYEDIDVVIEKVSTDLSAGVISPDHLYVWEIGIDEVPYEYDLDYTELDGLAVGVPRG